MRPIPMIAAAALACACSSSLPKGTPGPAADALARRIEAAINNEAWQNTGAVRWTFNGRNEHLWDRQRDLIRVRWGNTEVLRHLWSDRGRAFEDAEEVTDPDRRTMLMTKGYAAWVNDAFWLNPLEKLFDAGAVRGVATGDDGREGLLVTFTRGGLTPGDSYLWFVDAGGRPTAWQMWVSIMPLGGVETTWEGWVRLRTGAMVSTRHVASLYTLELTDVAGARTLSELVKDADPFASIL